MSKPLYLMEKLEHQKCDNQLAKLPIEVKKALCDIVEEHDRAIAKFPEWPVDILHAASVVGEESGELTRAALQSTYENGAKDNCLKEAVQTGAMAIRFILKMDSYNTYPNTK